MVTGSIVLFQNDEKIVRQAIDSFMDTQLDKHLFLIDNSSTDILRRLKTSKDITYIHLGDNIGFGKAHNTVINEIKVISDYHLILNPDAYFEPDVIPVLIEYLDKHPDIGVVAPRIVYPDGMHQDSTRRFPTGTDFLLRRIPGMQSVFKERYRNAHYLDSNLNEPLEVDTVSGCFQLFRTKIFTDIGGFDPRYFMYMEDMDICRKVSEHGYKTYYNPNVQAVHIFEKGSAKKLRLLLIHVTSIIKYFLKWRK